MYSTGTEVCKQTHVASLLECRVQTARECIQRLELAPRSTLRHALDYRRSLRSILRRTLALRVAASLLGLERWDPALHRRETLLLHGLDGRVSGAHAGEEVRAMVAVADADGAGGAVLVRARLGGDGGFFPGVV
jgi:hypothetical protein